MIISTPTPRPLRTAALAAAGGLLAGVLALTSVTTAGAATAAFTGRATLVSEWTHGTAGRGGSYGPWSPSQGSAATQTTVDSSTASAAESKGVALIDTVLSNGEAAGTGIVLTSDGEVLTNYHVVEDSTSIRVTIASTGETYPATVVGHDQTADIALLQLKDASGLTISKIDDDTVKTGDDVTAVGNAGGTGVLTAADGEITKLSTSLTTASEGGAAGERLKGMLETDADVVAGDSGGPLVDHEGEVVGIDTAASSGPDIVGYAIPIDTALAVVTQILNGNETAAVRIGPDAFLGVELSPTTSTDGYGYGYTDGTGWSTGADTYTDSGATIAGVVEGGAADDAGLTAGDTVTKIGNSAISDATDLSDTMAKLNPGDQVKITWTTADGSSRSAIATLGSSPVN